MGIISTTRLSLVVLLSTLATQSHSFVANHRALQHHAVRNDKSCTQQLYHSSKTTTENNNVVTTYSSSAQVFGEKCEAGGTVLDESSMLDCQGFPINAETLVDKAKYALLKDSGVLEPSLWADDFEFCAPYVGPLSKDEFLKAADGFGIYEAFPDFDNRYFGFTVDPLEPGRVWFFTRLKATNSGGLFGKEPNDQTVELPPQVYSFKFNKEGLITELTVGYSVDRRQGDTGGLGGMFGLFYGVGQGLPFPEGQPYQLSKRFRFFQWIGGVVSRLNNNKG